MRRTFVPFLLVSLALGGTAAAQDVPKLRGLAALAVGASEPDDHSRACGIAATSPFEIAVRDLIEGAGVKHDPGSDAVLWVAVETLYVDDLDLCVSHLLLEASEFRTLEFSRAGGEATAEVMLWRRNAVTASEPVEHRGDVAKWVDDLTFEFVSDWSKAQGTAATR